MKIIIGTTSKIKERALKEVLHEKSPLVSYTLVSYDVESLVPDTPYGSQTYLGAKNRAETLFRTHSNEGSLFVGLESGLVERENKLFEECWCVMLDSKSDEYVGYSSGLMLPIHITKEMERGKTHIEVLREIAEKLGVDSKDTWSIYSNGSLSRTASIKEAFRNALLSVR